MVKALDYEVIERPNEVRMRSAKQNQDLRSKDCKHAKHDWHKPKIRKANL